MKPSIRRRAHEAPPDPMEQIRAELDEELAMLRQPDASEKLRRAFAMTPEEIAKAANAARRRKR